MKKKGIYTIFIVIMLVLFCVIGYYFYQYLRVKNAKIEVVLVDELKIEFGDHKKISDFIVRINGKNILNDREISSNELGKQEVSFSYINNDKIKVKYVFEVEVIDSVEPLIWLGERYRVKKDAQIVLTEEILCGDNYDNNPTCIIEGSYDLSTVGDYPLVFKASDSSGNTYEHPFTLTVYEPNPPSNNNQTEDHRIDFNQIIKNYKTDQNQIGIDVSSWQGDIDFEKLKKAGVEFMFIRVGSKNSNGEYFVDKKFERNIKLANQYGIPVGIYFYSYANSTEEARKDARWVLKQIKGYKIDLPIAYDWEDWENFNAYHLSFFGLTSMAEAFLEEIEKANYQGLLYSSKAYLENIWFPTNYDIWLAHYTTKTNYKGKYRFWQMTSSAKVEGINGAVDVDIFYP